MPSSALVKTIFLGGPIDVPFRNLMFEIISLSLATSIPVISCVTPFSWLVEPFHHLQP
jgi:hypothetical protein